MSEQIRSKNALSWSSSSLGMGLQTQELGSPKTHSLNLYLNLTEIHRTMPSTSRSPSLTLSQPALRLVPELTPTSAFPAAYTNLCYTIRKDSLIHQVLFHFLIQLFSLFSHVSLMFPKEPCRPFHSAARGQARTPESGGGGRWVHMGKKRG